MPLMRRSLPSRNVGAFLDPATHQESHNSEVSSPLKTSADLTLIKSALSSSFVFEGFQDEDLARLIDCMQLHHIKAYETVVDKFQSALNFYIVASGKLEATNAQGVRRIILPGESFGELALLHDSPSTETVRTLKETNLWALERFTFRDTVAKVHAKAYAENRTFLESVPLFDRLTGEQKDNLVSCLIMLSYKIGDLIVKEGDHGFEFYIIKSGEVLCSQSGTEIRRLGPGSYFGEQSLLHGGLRTATIAAVSQTICLSLTHDDLLSAFGSQLQLIIFRNTLQIALEKHEFLGKLSCDQREALIKAIDYVKYSVGEAVNVVNNLVVVVRGALGSKTGEVYGSYAVLGKGFFEEREEDAEEREEDREGREENGEESVECKTVDADVAHISKERFELVLGGNFLKAAQNNLTIKTLKQLPIFRKLAYDHLRDLSQALKVKTYQDGDLLIDIAAPITEVFFLQSGKVDIYTRDRLVRTFHRGSPIGEQCLTPGFQTSSVRAVAKGEVTAWSFPQVLLHQLLDDPVKAELHERALMLDTAFFLAGLRPVKPLGKGLVANVYLTYEPGERRLYALKFILKSRAVQLDLVKALLQERKILMNLDHHMVLKMYATFRDSKRVYFLTEYIHSESFFSLMRRHDLLTEDQAMFYTACCIEILGHLQERDIIYRDLKPENILIDGKGYPKLIDFSTSKMIQGRTYSVVGTPYYMAPEVIKGKGYGTSADLWSLGIMLFEMVFGCVPFGEEQGDPIAIYQQVLFHNIQFPTRVSPQLESLINQLLSVNSAMRSSGSISNLRSHKFFHTFPWEQLRSREYPPPLAPKLPTIDEQDLLGVEATALEAALVVVDIQAQEQGDSVWIRRDTMTEPVTPSRLDEVF